MGQNASQAAAEKPHTCFDCNEEIFRRLASELPSFDAAEYEMGRAVPVTPKDTVKDENASDTLSALQVIPLDGNFSVAVSRVGGKARNLMQMSSIEAVQVPPGIVVPTDVFRCCVPRQFSLELSDAELENVCSSIEQSTLPDETCRSLNDFLSSFPGDAVWAVRSSGTNEDGSEHSLAGLAESFMFVPSGKVEERIKSCWISLFQRRVISYISALGGNEDASVEMAVVVQLMVDAKRAGVLFTLHPTLGVDSLMAVECVYGMGEGLVGGEITPASFSVDLDGSVKKEGGSSQLKKMIRAEEQGLVLADTTNEERDLDPLSSEDLMQLHRIGVAIASHYGCPQDVEFVVAKDSLQIFVVQTRPITKFSSKGVPGYWYNGFAKKSWLAMSISSMTGYFTSFTWGTTQANKTKEREMIKTIFGLAYVNGDMASMTAKKVIDMSESWMMARAHVQHSKELEGDCWTILNSLELVSDQDLAALVRATIYERLELAFLSFHCGNMARELQKEAETLLYELNSSLEPDIFFTLADVIWNVREQSAQATRELESLVAMLRADAVAAKIFATTPRAQILSALAGTSFLPVLQRYIRSFWYMCENDEDIFETRWIDDPTPALLMIQKHLEAPLRTHSSLKKPKLIEWLESPEKAPKAAQKLIPVMKKLRSFLFWKDEVHESYTRANFFGCAFFLRLGERLGIGQGIFDADYQSILKYFDTGNKQALLKTISRHHDIRAMYANWKEPVYFYRGVPSVAEPIKRRVLEEQIEDGGLVLEGKAGSAGTFRGKVRVCQDLNGASQLQPGEVLVAHMTSPSWTPLFSICGAVVVEAGGVLSHAAVVARELGVPAVLNVRSALDILQTGQEVLVDGSRGTVTVSKQAAGSFPHVCYDVDAVDVEDENLAFLMSSRDDLTSSRNN